MPATVAAPATRTPTAIRARAASASVLPVVTRSSTRTTLRGPDRVEDRTGSAANLPADARPRSAAVSAAVSGRPDAGRRTGATSTGIPGRRSSRAAPAASRSTCWPPLARATPAAEGTGTSQSGSLRPPSSSVTAAASAAARTPVRSRRPRSLYASRQARAAPAYGAATASGGRPAGTGSGRCGRGRTRPRPHRKHSGPRGSRHATQRLGRARSASKEITRRPSRRRAGRGTPSNTSVDDG